MKREYRDGVKRRETRPGWMGECCHGDKNQQAHALIYYHVDYTVFCDNIGMYLLIVRVQRSSPWQHVSIYLGLVSLLFVVYKLVMFYVDIMLL